MVFLAACGVQKPDPSEIKGEWYRGMYHHPGYLIIDNADEEKFSFSLEVFSGSHTGIIDSLAYWHEDTAVFQHYLPDSSRSCRLLFYWKKDQFHIEESGIGNGCDLFRGHKTFFSGHYSRTEPKEPGLYDQGAFDSKQQDTAFKNLVGDYYKDFVRTTMYKFPIENLDRMKAKGLAYGVTGLFKIMESIIMYNNRGDMWAAIIVKGGSDNKKLKVTYFTNDEQFKEELPKTIKHWKKDFDQYPVEYHYKPQE